MIKKVFFIVLSLHLLCSSLTLHSSYFISPDPQSRIKAVFIYNFSKYFEWPSNNSTQFVIGILNNERVANELKEITQNRKVGSLNVIIKNYKTVKQIERCHLLYVADNTVSIVEISKIVKKYNGIIISERPNGIQQGAIINFTVVDSKQKFELSKSNAKRSNVKVSQSLTTLAINVD